MFKEINFFTNEKDLINQFLKLKKIIKKLYKARIFLYEDEEEGYPENKFIVAEIQKQFPDGIIFIAISRNIDEIIRQIEDYINYTKPEL